MAKIRGKYCVDCLDQNKKRLHNNEFFTGRKDKLGRKYKVGLCCGCADDYDLGEDTENDN